MQLLTIDPTVDPLWCDLITRQHSHLFLTPQWLRVIKETYGFEMRAHVLASADGPVAGVAFGHIRDPFGDRLVSVPFSDFGDPVVSSAEQWSQLSAALRAEAHPIKLRCLHNTIPLGDDQFTYANRTKWHGIDLTLGKEALWQHLHSSARRAIRKAEKAGVTLRFSTSLDDMRLLRRFHIDVRKRKLRMIAQPERFFEQIWQQIIVPGNGFIVVAELDGEPIATTMFLHWKQTMTYKFNASPAMSLNVRPNDYIIWKTIEHAVDRGFTSFDFGLSDWDQDGLVRYKRKFATEEKTIHFLNYTPDGWEPTAAQSMRSLFPQLTQLFTDPGVPAEVVSEAGNLLYRYFI